MTAVLSITKTGRRLGEVSKVDLGIRAEKPSCQWLAGKSKPLIFFKLLLQNVILPPLLMLHPEEKGPAKGLHQQKSPVKVSTRGRYMNAAKPG